MNKQINGNHYDFRLFDARDIRIIKMIDAKNPLAMA